MAETESRNWSGIDCDLLAEIASRIQLWEDFVSFAGVCRSWRSEAADRQNNFKYKSSSQIPWLMFPQKVSLAEEHHNDNLVIKFFSLSRGMSRFVTLPESANHTRYFSSRGWLIKTSPDLSKPYMDFRPSTEPGAGSKKEHFYGTYEFVVLELDSSTGDWTPIKSLGTRSLFLGHNSSVSIDSSNNSHCKSNCIYFTDGEYQEIERR